MPNPTIERRLTFEADTQALAQQLASAKITGSVWLSGDLGAGKTTLTRYWLQALGHQGRVKSPTYTLVEPYEISLALKVTGEPQKDSDRIRVYHADLYRLQDPEELDFIGFEEYLDDKEALIIIEWASRAADCLPPPVMTIDMQIGQDEQQQTVRQVTISASATILAHLSMAPLAL